LFFFFSSRRRHTRFSRDWSSDVCSSDLFHVDILVLGRGLVADHDTAAAREQAFGGEAVAAFGAGHRVALKVIEPAGAMRAEALDAPFVLGHGTLLACSSVRESTPSATMGEGCQRLSAAFRVRAATGLFRRAGGARLRVKGGAR